MFFACSAAPPPRYFLISGAAIAGRAGTWDLELEGGRISDVRPHSAGTKGDVELGGRFIAPSFIDAHVHLAYDPAGDELLRRGVAGVVDLAAPLDFLSAPHGALRVVASGPMITAVRGYPTRGWGRDGYGIECGTAAEIEAAVDRVVAKGARVIKVPVTEAPSFDDALLAAAVRRAHERGLKVAVHALDDRSALRAARAGADVLAHTPVEPLSEETLALWGSRAVISTLAAFGATEATIANLRALRARGATLIYGTDLGNTGDAGISLGELEALELAGLDGAAILRAGTEAPARYFGFEGLGELAAGKAASFLVLEKDPVKSPETLARPVAVWVDGARVE